MKRKQNLKMHGQSTNSLNGVGHNTCLEKVERNGLSWLQNGIKIKEIDTDKTRR